MKQPKNIGRTISWIRLLRVMKKEDLALAMGIKLQTVIQIENSKSVEEWLLLKVAEALGVSVEGIKNFSEDAVIDYISSKIGPEDNVDMAAIAGVNPHFAVLDKLVHSYEENKRLYERLLDSEKEKVGYMEKLLDK